MRASIQIQDGRGVLVVPASQQGRLCPSSGTAGGNAASYPCHSLLRIPVFVQNSIKTAFDLAEQKFHPWRNQAVALHFQLE